MSSSDISNTLERHKFPEATPHFNSLVPRLITKIGTSFIVENTGGGYCPIISYCHAHHIYPSKLIVNSIYSNLEFFLNNCSDDNSFQHSGIISKQELENDIKQALRGRPCGSTIFSALDHIYSTRTICIGISNNGITSSVNSMVTSVGYVVFTDGHYQALITGSMIEEFLISINSLTDDSLKKYVDSYNNTLDEKISAFEKSELYSDNELYCEDHLKIKSTLPKDSKIRIPQVQANVNLRFGIKHLFGANDPKFASIFSNNDIAYHPSEADPIKRKNMKMSINELSEKLAYTERLLLINLIISVIWVYYILDDNLTINNIMKTCQNYGIFNWCLSSDEEYKDLLDYISDIIMPGKMHTSNHLFERIDFCITHLHKALVNYDYEFDISSKFDPIIKDKLVEKIFLPAAQRMFPKMRLGTNKQVSRQDITRKNSDESFLKLSRYKDIGDFQQSLRNKVKKTPHSRGMEVFSKQSEAELKKIPYTVLNSKGNDKPEVDKDKRPKKERTEKANKDSSSQKGSIAPGNKQVRIKIEDTNIKIPANSGIYSFHDNTKNKNKTQISRSLESFRLLLGNRNEFSRRVILLRSERKITDPLSSELIEEDPEDIERTNIPDLTKNGLTSNNVMAGPNIQTFEADPDDWHAVQYKHIKKQRYRVRLGIQDIVDDHKGSLLSKFSITTYLNQHFKHIRHTDEFSHVIARVSSGLLSYKDAIVKLNEINDSHIALRADRADLKMMGSRSRDILSKNPQVLSKFSSLLNSMYHSESEIKKLTRDNNYSNSMVTSFHLLPGSNEVLFHDGCLTVGGYTSFLNSFPDQSLDSFNTLSPYLQISAFSGNEPVLITTLDLLRWFIVVADDVDRVNQDEKKSFLRGNFRSCLHKLVIFLNDGLYVRTETLREIVNYIRDDICKSNETGSIYTTTQIPPGVNQVLNMLLAGSSPVFILSSLTEEKPKGVSGFVETSISVANSGKTVETDNKKIREDISIFYSDYIRTYQLQQSDTSVAPICSIPFYDVFLEEKKNSSFKEAVLSTPLQKISNRYKKHFIPPPDKTSALKIKRNSDSPKLSSEVIVDNSYFSSNLTSGSSVSLSYLRSLFDDVDKRELAIFKSINSYFAQTVSQRTSSDPSRIIHDIVIESLRLMIGTFNLSKQLKDDFHKPDLVYNGISLEVCAQFKSKKSISEQYVSRGRDLILINKYDFLTERMCALLSEYLVVSILSDGTDDARFLTHLYKNQLGSAVESLTHNSSHGYDTSALINEDIIRILNDSDAQQTVGDIYNACIMKRNLSKDLNKKTLLSDEDMKNHICKRKEVLTKLMSSMSADESRDRILMNNAPEQTIQAKIIEAEKKFARDTMKGGYVYNNKEEKYVLTNKGYSVANTPVEGSVSFTESSHPSNVKLLSQVQSELAEKNVRALKKQDRIDSGIFRSFLNAQYKNYIYISLKTIPTSDMSDEDKKIFTEQLFSLKPLGKKRKSKRTSKLSHISDPVDSGLPAAQCSILVKYILLFMINAGHSNKKNISLLHNEDMRMSYILDKCSDRDPENLKSIMNELSQRLNDLVKSTIDHSTSHSGQPYDYLYTVNHLSKTAVGIFRDCQICSDIKNEYDSTVSRMRDYGYKLSKLIDPSQVGAVLNSSDSSGKDDLASSARKVALAPVVMRNAIKVMNDAKKAKKHYNNDGTLGSDDVEKNGPSHDTNSSPKKIETYSSEKSNLSYEDVLNSNDLRPEELSMFKHRLEPVTGNFPVTKRFLNKQLAIKNDTEDSNITDFASPEASMSVDLICQISDNFSNMSSVSMMLGKMVPRSALTSCLKRLMDIQLCFNRKYSPESSKMNKKTSATINDMKRRIKSLKKELSGLSSDNEKKKKNLIARIENSEKTLHNIQSGLQKESEKQKKIEGELGLTFGCNNLSEAIAVVQSSKRSILTKCINDHLNRDKSVRIDPSLTDVVEEYDWSSDRDNSFFSEDVDRDYLLMTLNLPQRVSSSIRQYLYKCRPFHELCLKRKISNLLSTNRNWVDTCVFTDEYTDLRVFIKRFGSPNKKDSGFYLLNYVNSTGSSLKMESWQYHDIIGYSTASSRFFMLVCDVFSKSFVNGVLTQTSNDRSTKILDMYLSILSSNSWGPSLLFKVYRYYVQNFIAKSTTLDKTFDSLIEALSDDGLYVKDELKNKECVRFFLKNLLSSENIIGTPMFHLGETELGVETCLMNLCCPNTSGAKKHLARIMEETHSEIVLARDNFEDFRKQYFRSYEIIKGYADARDKLIKKKDQSKGSKFFKKGEVISSLDSIKDDPDMVKIISKTAGEINSFFDEFDVFCQKTNGRFTYNLFSAAAMYKSTKWLTSSIHEDLYCVPSLRSLCSVRSSFNQITLGTSTATMNILNTANAYSSFSVCHLAIRILFSHIKLDLSFKMFDKDQLGGDREISIMGGQFRCIQALSENVARGFGKITGIDMLADDLKNKKLCDIFSDTIGQESLYFSADQTRWGPNFNTITFGIMMYILSRKSSQAYLPSIINLICEFKIFETSYAPRSIREQSTHSYSIPGFLGRFHMGQGIFHYNSSLYHSLMSKTVSAHISAISSNLNPGDTVVSRNLVTSDDAGSGYTFHHPRHTIKPIIIDEVSAFFKQSEDDQDINVFCNDLSVNLSNIIENSVFTGYTDLVSDVRNISRSGVVSDRCSYIVRAIKKAVSETCLSSDVNPEDYADNILKSVFGDKNKENGKKKNKKKDSTSLSKICSSRRAVASLLRDNTDSFTRYFGIKSSNYKNVISKNSLEFNTFYLFKTGLGDLSTKFLNSCLDGRTTGDFLGDLTASLNKFNDVRSTGVSQMSSYIAMLVSFKTTFDKWKVPIQDRYYPNMSTASRGAIEYRFLSNSMSEDKSTILKHKNLRESANKLLSYTDTCSEINEIRDDVYNTIKNQKTRSDTLMCHFVPSLQARLYTKKLFIDGDEHVYNKSNLSRNIALYGFPYHRSVMTMTDIRVYFPVDSSEDIKVKHKNQPNFVYIPYLVQRAFGVKKDEIIAGCFEKIQSIDMDSSYYDTLVFNIQQRSINNVRISGVSCRSDQINQVVFAIDNFYRDEVINRGSCGSYKVVKDNSKIPILLRPNLRFISTGIHKNKRDTINPNKTGFVPGRLIDKNNPMPIPSDILIKSVSQVVNDNCKISHVEDLIEDIDQFRGSNLSLKELVVGTRSVKQVDLLTTDINNSIRSRLFKNIRNMIIPPDLEVNSDLRSLTTVITEKKGLDPVDKKKGEGMSSSAESKKPLVKENKDKDSSNDPSVDSIEKYRAMSANDLSLLFVRTQESLRSFLLMKHTINIETVKELLKMWTCMLKYDLPIFKNDASFLENMSEYMTTKCSIPLIRDFISDIGQLDNIDDLDSSDIETMEVSLRDHITSAEIEKHNKGVSSIMSKGDDLSRMMSALGLGDMVLMSMDDDDFSYNPNRAKGKEPEKTILEKIVERDPEDLSDESEFEFFPMSDTSHVTLSNEDDYEEDDDDYNSDVDIDSIIQCLIDDEDTSYLYQDDDALDSACQAVLTYIVKMALSPFDCNREFDTLRSIFISAMADYNNDDQSNYMCGEESESDEEEPSESVDFFLFHKSSCMKDISGSQSLLMTAIAIRDMIDSGEAVLTIPKEKDLFSIFEQERYKRQTYSADNIRDYLERYVVEEIISRLRVSNFRQYSPESNKKLFVQYFTRLLCKSYRDLMQSNDFINIRIPKETDYECVKPLLDLICENMFMSDIPLSTLNDFFFISPSTSDIQSMDLHPNCDISIESELSNDCNIMSVVNPNLDLIVLILLGYIPNSDIIMDSSLYADIRIRVREASKTIFLDIKESNLYPELSASSSILHSSFLFPSYVSMETAMDLCGSIQMGSLLIPDEQESNDKA